MTDVSLRQFYGLKPCQLLSEKQRDWLASIMAEFAPNRTGAIMAARLDCAAMCDGCNICEADVSNTCNGSCNNQCVNY
jgi:hypothetical protein